MIRMTGLVAVLVLAAAACTSGSTESISAEAVPDEAGVPVDPVPIDVAIDDAGVVWMLEATADQWTLRASLPGEEQVAVELGAGSDRPQGFTLIPFGADQALGRVACAEQSCALAVYVASYDGTQIAAPEQWRLELEAEPAAVTVVGSDEDQLVVNVDDTVYRFVRGSAPSGVGRVGGESNVGVPCLVGSEVLAPRYNLGAPGDETVTGEVVQVTTAGDWEPVADAAFSYDFTSEMEFRCGPDRLELALPDQVAQVAWTEGGQRLDGAPSDIDWVDAPYTYDPLGLLGVEGTAVVRLDSLTGETLARAEGPPLLQERWASSSQPDMPPLSDTIALSPAGDTAAVCFAESAEDERANGTCVVWEA